MRTLFCGEVRPLNAMCEQSDEGEPAPIETQTRVPSETDEGESIVTQTRAP